VFIKSVLFMKVIIYFFLVVFSLGLYAQDTSTIVEEIQHYQAELNAEFANPDTTILEKDDFESFKQLQFYPIDLTYYVQAKLVRTPNEKPFFMPTTTDRLPEYVKYGELHFKIDSLDLVLDVFQNTTPKEEYKNNLFLPFTDWTSGDGSYGGGRYIDVLIPEVDSLYIDFNKAYNPYCAYNKNYSCPIPPKQNDLPIRVEAGVKDFLKVK